MRVVSVLCGVCEVFSGLYKSPSLGPSVSNSLRPASDGGLDL